MLGAIAGEIIGSVYEARPIKTTQFRLFHPLCRFTDDTVLTVALLTACMASPIGSPAKGNSTSESKGANAASIHRPSGFSRERPQR